ncbi:MAG: mitochondrial fission ELM1 family protein [Candidatus Omnitrophica bacterium]|nr:mitochondrial fission ELM1 family protein [Candidatus Omnitrophota bacterium]
MMRKTFFEDVLILSVAKGLRLFVRFSPLSFSLFLARCLGNAAYFLSKRRIIAIRNLRAAFAGEKTTAEIKRIARRSFQNLALSAVELLRAPEFDQGYLARHVEFAGLERFQPFLGKRGGLIFLTAHFGSWELLNIFSGMLGHPMAALARPQKHPLSDQFLNSLRASKGSVLIRKGMNVREILRALRDGKVVGILNDQDGGKKGIFVPFFGRLSSTPSGAAAFARRVGCPVFPVFIVRTGKISHRVEVEAPLFVSEDSQPEKAEEGLLREFAAVLESKIRRFPDQWLWAHRRWKSTPDRFVLILSDGKNGHLHQSLAAFRALEELRCSQGFEKHHTHLKIVPIRFKTKAGKFLMRSLFWMTRGHVPFKEQVLKSVLEEASFRELAAAYADVVLSCGSSLLAAHLYAKEENAAKSIVLMKPGSLSCGRFEAVVVPWHDRMRQKKNVFVTRGALSFVDQKEIQEQACRWSSRMALSSHSRKIGLLIGGETRKTQWNKTIFGEWVKKWIHSARHAETFFLVTSSRRTPVWAEELLKQTFQGKAYCPFLVIANEKNLPGAVPAILGLSDILIVSGESLSMVSEAIASGKPVFVFTPTSHKMKPKYRRFLNRMTEDRAVVWVTPDNFDETLRNAVNGAHKPVGDGGMAGHDREILKRAAERVL